MTGVGYSSSGQSSDKAAAGHAAHVFLNASDLEWAPAPASLPPGAEAAVLEGNPAEEGPFTLRIKLPANYRIAPHWHPGVEHVTVISGSFHINAGEAADYSTGKALQVGGFMAMPPKSPHYAWTTEEALIQLHGIGPWGITYVNESDDPRKAAQ